MKSLLDKLGIKEVNPGACIGPDGWLEDPKGKKIVSHNPSTGEEIASVVQVTPSMYEKVVTAGQDAFKSWRTIPAPKRGALVRDLGNALRELKEPLGDLVTLEMGKIRAEGHGEVQEMIDICDFAVGLSRQLYGLTMHSERPGHRMYEQWHPLGLIAVITAFNFPVAVWAWNAAIAAVCGDSALWKPSELAPLCSIAVQNIANRVMADHGVTGVFNLINGSGQDIGELIINDNRIPMVSFTGSTKVGQHVSEAVARRFGRTILELGGNNAIIVTEDADIEMATRGILFGAVGTAGQRCTSTRRIIVHKDVAPKLEKKLVSAYEQLRIGNPLDNETLVGPLIVNKSVQTMVDAVERAQADGGEVIYGGKRLPEIGPNFVEPTIIKMPLQTDIVKEETFAPVLYLMEYDELDQAIEIHNGVPQGLSSAIFTDSMREMEMFLSTEGSDCGIANVNIGTSGAEIGGAFGGEKETGGGRESGSDAWRQYMRRQTNTINYSNDLPLAQGIKFG
ncbi:MAG: aldehyde dehydrogenase family protein [Anaerolineales bacterium]|nr:aldehyde dehydrogenase family protein [Chloroflexota bacterium]MBL6981340.1 aldehyde dehydrogenase family protein [Anaerolineales bacterium]